MPLVFTQKKSVLVETYVSFPCTVCIFSMCVYVASFLLLIQPCDCVHIVSVHTFSILCTEVHNYLCIIVI